MPLISPARRAAFDVLLAIERGASHADDLLRAPEVNALGQQDKNLATALVYGVLRWQILLDHQFLELLTHPNVRLDPEVAVALRLGAFQLRRMDRIPAHAAIGESVELCKIGGHRFAARMVNAVLRKVPRAPFANLSCGTPATLALATAHPLWLVERWAEQYGLDATSAICLYGQQQPKPVIRLTNSDAESALSKDGLTLVPGRLLAAACVIISGDPTPQVVETGCRLQDEGSQLVAELAASSHTNQNQGKILDACAAPGGKTLILAERFPEAQIVACESSPVRFTALRQRLAPFGPRVECRLADVSTLDWESVFDLALVDAPCSGTGTLGRNPEIRHRLRPNDLVRQAERQRAILSSALCAIRPGGRVLYSSCSLEHEENEDVIDAVLGATSCTRLISLAGSIRAASIRGILLPAAEQTLVDSLTPQGTLQLLPGCFGTDGFFLALLERVP